MKVLISIDNVSFQDIAAESAHVTFSAPGPAALFVPLSSPIAVDLWICDGAEVTDEILSVWLDRGEHAPKVMLAADPTQIPRIQGYRHANLASIMTLPSRPSNPSLSRAESILRGAEMLYTSLQLQNEVTSLPLVSDGADTPRVLLVGAGIMNLMTAELLATQGYHVRVVDAGPDPRQCNDWTRLGVTSGGGNARMFTQTEADNYNEKADRVYQNMRPIFRHVTRDGGWCVKAPEDFNAAELDWVDTFEKLPAWLARSFQANIHAVNREAGALWNDLMVAKPALFEDVGLHRDILRMYVEPDVLQAARVKHQKLGTLIHDSSPQEYLEAYPRFTPAAQSGELAGGFTVQGFTLSIHLFMAKLIDYITKLGGGFTWDCEVQRMQRDDGGRVVGLDSQVGHLQADHYVVSAGVSGNALLQGTASQDLIQGVLGVWLQLPNLHPQLQNSIKIHRRGHLVEDINVTVSTNTETGEDILVLGGGYGYVGQDRPAHDNPELLAIFSELEEVARTYFPQQHALAKVNDTLWPRGHKKFCIRPFTATGLGVFEQIPTASGGQLVITGGNNTGGFAQAPAIARAVSLSLAGKQDPIHVLYHPNRGRLPRPPLKALVDQDSLALRKFEARYYDREQPQNKPLVRATL